MSGVLVVAEEVGGELRDVTFELVAAGRSLGSPLVVAVVTVDPDHVADRLALAGVDELVLVPVGMQPTSDTQRRAVAALVAELRPSWVVGGFTVDGMGWGPAVAAELGLGFASDVIACGLEDGAPVARREFYAGKVQADLEFPDVETVVLLLRPTIWEPTSEPGVPKRRAFELPPGADRVRHRAYVLPTVGDVDIAAAEFVLAIGRGIGERENIASFEALAARLGAVLGSSRPLVDAGWMPASRQVGQSGNTVKPKLYLAFGISGAVQHIAGMKGSGTIVAVNSDPDAAIFGVADYGVVADLFDVVDELEALA